MVHIFTQRIGAQNPPIAFPVAANCGKLMLFVEALVVPRSEHCQECVSHHQLLLGEPPLGNLYPIFLEFPTDEGCG